MADEEFAELVLTVVERIPAGRAMSYGAIAEYLGRGGPRQVGAVMSHYGGGVPWHRVVAANGRLVPGHEVEALRRHQEEGTPLRGDKVDLRKAAWWPDESESGDESESRDESESGDKTKSGDETERGDKTDPRRKLKS